MEEKSREKCKESLSNFLDENSCIIIKNLKNIRYLSGFTGTSGVIYMEMERSFFISDARYEKRCYEEVKNFEILIVKDPFEEAVKRCGSKKQLFIEYPDFSLTDLERVKGQSKEIEIKDISPIIMKFRMKKEEDEKKLIRSASKINKRAFERFLNFLQENVGKITEEDAVLELEYIMRKEGSEGPYFPTIVASGERASVPHAKPSNKKIKRNTVLLIDFGSVKKGYSTDETITIFVGKVDGEYKKIWEIVKDAKNYAISSIKIGEKLSLPEERAREFLSKFNLEKFFVHSIGHGIGLEVHEPPKLSIGSNDLFEEGMIFTIEPGVYIKGKFGIRLEDVVCLSSCGVDVLTEINKEEMLCV